MEILIIILSIIGLLKLVSLFVLYIIEIYYHIIKVEINGITKEYGIYKNDGWYIVPTIQISKTNKYFEISVKWLYLQYYASYYISKDEE